MATATTAAAVTVTRIRKNHPRESTATDDVARRLTTALRIFTPGRRSYRPPAGSFSFRQTSRPSEPEKGGHFRTHRVTDWFRPVVEVDNGKTGQRERKSSCTGFGESGLGCISVRPAIIAAVEARHSPLEDLLVGEAASLSGVDFLEREHLAKVLAEQKLSASGLTSPDTAIRIGRLLSADALVLIESEVGGDASTARLKVVETRSGVRLVDRLAPIKDACRTFLLSWALHPLDK